MLATTLAEDALRMEDSNLKSVTQLAPLPGAVCRQFRTRGEKTFGPYYFRFWREGGRLRKQYVKPHAVAEVQDACGRHRKQAKDRAMTNAITSMSNRSLTRLLNILWGEDDTEPTEADWDWMKLRGLLK